MLTSGHDIGYMSSYDKPAAPARTNKSQIYIRTHNSEGGSDTYINRSHLSFSFGGKNIEEFELVITSQGMMQKSLTGGFRDLTSSYDVIDGQFYWGTYFANNQIDLTVSTESMTQEHLDAFVNWFKPGETRELIMAEHPNRAIMARIMSAPIMNIVPFEEITSVIIGNVTYPTSTTLYKGDINLSFIMDSPFWYAKSNLLAISEDTIITQWNDANGEPISDITEDMARIILEDRVIPKEAISISNVFGDRFICINAEENNIKIIDDALLQIEKNSNLDALFNFNSELSLGSGDKGYVFYGGTAPAKPIIQFTLPTTYDGNGLIKLPFNSITKATGSTNYAYNTITLEGEEKQLLQISAPNVYISYNQAQICINNATSYKNLRELLNDKVTHFHVHRWASRAIDYMEYYNIAWNNTARNRLKNVMSYFTYNTEASKYVIDGNTNHAYAKLAYRKIIDGQDFPSGDAGWQSFGEANSDIEDVSDIVVSDYIELKERNHLNAKGRLQAWGSKNRTLSHRLYHNFGTTLTNVAILFKNMYY